MHAAPNSRGIGVDPRSVLLRWGYAAATVCAVGGLLYRSGYLPTALKLGGVLVAGGAVMLYTCQNSMLYIPKPGARGIRACAPACP